MVEAILSQLTKDTENAIKWFVNTYILTNPLNFQFMFLTSLICKEEIAQMTQVNDIIIACKVRVHVLGIGLGCITVDSKLRFHTYVDNLCRNAAR